MPIRLVILLFYSFQDPLSLACRQHVSGHDIAYDASNEGVTPSVSAQPPLPFQLIEGAGERTNRGPRDSFECLRIDAIAKDRRRS